MQVQLQSLSANICKSPCYVRQAVHFNWKWPTSFCLVWSQEPK